MTWFEYYCITEGHEIKLQREWDHTRNLMMQMYNTSTKFKNPIREVTEIMKLPLVDNNNFDILSVQQDSTYSEFQDVLKTRKI